MNLMGNMLVQGKRVRRTLARSVRARLGLLIAIQCTALPTTFLAAQNGSGTLQLVETIPDARSDSGWSVAAGPGKEDIYNWDEPTHSWGIFVFTCPSQQHTGANCYSSVTVPGSSPVVPIFVRQKGAVVPLNLTLHATAHGGPGGATSLGCYKDSGAADDLARSQSNTVEGCVQVCLAKGFAFAGVQYGQSCPRGNSYGKYGPANNCNMKCTGNANETCGGYGSNSVYPTGVASTSTESGTNRLGSDYTSFWQDRDYWTVCQQACNADARCKAYTHVRAGLQGKQAHCWLKSAAPPGHADA